MRRVAVNVLTLAISLLLALGLGEVALRVYSAVQPNSRFRALDPMGVLIEPHGSFGFRQRPGAVFHYENGTAATTNSSGYRGPVVPPQSVPGTIRIILFGGSATFGWGVSDDKTIDAYMRQKLAERFPAQHFDVVNLGFDGYDSYQDLQRLRSDGVPMHPSIVILNTGLNDVRNAWYPNLRTADPRTLIWEDELRRLRAEQVNGGPTMWVRVKHYLFVARVPSFLREVIAHRRDVAAHSAGARVVPAAAVDSAHPGAKPPYPDAADYFETNVRQMVDLSTGAGAAVVLVTPPSSLRSYPPEEKSTRDYWIYNAKTTADYRDTLSHRLQTIASDEHAKGLSVTWIAPSLPKSLFFDDAHLTADGNAALAAQFVDALVPLLPAASARATLPH